ncbi:MAG: hypothetical protein M3017_09195 [Actinomycetota bacterium]|nr:hypothetical protein [Actinomycetota bacterium]
MAVRALPIGSRLGVWAGRLAGLAIRPRLAGLAIRPRLAGRVLRLAESPRLDRIVRVLRRGEGTLLGRIVLTRIVLTWLI